MDEVFFGGRGAEAVGIRNCQVGAACYGGGKKKEKDIRTNIGEKEGGRGRRGKTEDLNPEATTS